MEEKEVKKVVQISGEGPTIIDDSVCNHVNIEHVEAETDHDHGPFWRKWCHNGCRFWCRKYFWEGQLQSGKTVNEVEDATLFSDVIELTPARRKILSVIVPVFVFHFCWWSLMIKHGMWNLFVDKYPMTITMLFASIIAGMTSKGGGAVAFPVMTLVMGVSPSVARDFAVMIQSFGMGSSSFAILFMNVHIEITALVLCLIGGIVGLLLGIELIDSYLTPSMKKMGFVSIWFSFTFALFLLNRRHKRKTFNNIPKLNWWKRLLLLFVGLVGGIITSFAGSGVDICCYSILTLFFRVSEKVATPTSVIIMAMTSWVGFYWRGLVLMAISQESWEYLVVCIPVVVFGGPMGALLGSHFHRLVLATLVHIIDVAALVGAFAIVPQTAALAGGSVGVIVAGIVLFFVLLKLGDKILKSFGVEAQDIKAQMYARKKSKGASIFAINGHIPDRINKTSNKNGVTEIGYKSSSNKTSNINGVTGIGYKSSSNKTSNENGVTEIGYKSSSNGTFTKI